MRLGIPWSKITSAGKPPPPGHPLFFMTKAVQKFNTFLYQRSGGRIGGQFENAPALLLHHVGRRSGEKRTTPLVFARDGENVVVVGSYGGADKHPAWFLNVRANPDVEIEIGRDRLPVRAKVAGPEEREAMWAKVTEVWPSFDTYQGRTEREIPIVVLSPR